MKTNTFKALAFYSLFISVISVYLLWFVASNYPFQKATIKAVIPVDKAVYYPGDTIGFRIDSCNTLKFNRVTYQIENERNDHFYFVSLGSRMSIGFPGCWKVTDLSVKIPNDFFTSTTETREGRHRIFVIVENPQNIFIKPTIYETVWFDIRKSDKINL